MSNPTTIRDENGSETTPSPEGAEEGAEDNQFQIFQTYEDFVLTAEMLADGQNVSLLWGEATEDTLNYGDEDGRRELKIDNELSQYLTNIEVNYLVKDYDANPPVGDRLQLVMTFTIGDSVSTFTVDSGDLRRGNVVILDVERPTRLLFDEIGFASYDENYDSYRFIDSRSQNVSVVQNDLMDEYWPIVDRDQVIGIVYPDNIPAYLTQLASRFEETYINALNSLEPDLNLNADVSINTELANAGRVLASIYNDGDNVGSGVSPHNAVNKIAIA